MTEKTTQLVKVYVRQRPFTRRELDMKVPNVIRSMSTREITILNQKNANSEKKFVFDEIFNDKRPQSEIYKVVVSPLIANIISGYNCTVFAYGQTGTGKTHTMIGTFAPNEPKLVTSTHCGIILRAAEQLFAELARLPTNIEYTVRVSFIEIYNEDVRDLLVSHEADDSAPLRLCEDPENRGSVMIRGVVESTVCSTLGVCKLLDQGTNRRQTAATLLNRNSSRSHTVFAITVHTKESTMDNSVVIKTGKLNLVDLAGSENIGRSGALDKRAREAGNINKSLLTLGKVIKALTQKNQHIPYRDSKLTRILQDSLGGKTKTCMIATISPAATGLDETLSTLDYASDARNVVNCPQININRKERNMFKELNEEILSLQRELTAARTGEGFFISNENYAELETKLRDKTESLIGMVQRFDELQEYINLRNREYDEMMDSFKQTKRYLDRTKRERNLLYDCMVKREASLMGRNEDLRRLCEGATNDAEAFFSKYNQAYDKSMNNQMVLQHLHCFVEDSFREMISLLGGLKHDKLSQLVEVKAVLESNCIGDVLRALVKLQNRFGDEINILSLFDVNGSNYNLAFFDEIKNQLVDAIKCYYRKEYDDLGAALEEAVNVVAVKNETICKKFETIIQSTVEAFNDETQLLSELRSTSQDQEALVATIVELINSIKSDQVVFNKKLDNYERNNKMPRIIQALQANQLQLEENNSNMLVTLPAVISTQKESSQLTETLSNKAENFYQNLEELVTGITEKLTSHNINQAKCKNVQLKTIENVKETIKASNAKAAEIRREIENIDMSVDDCVRFNHLKLREAIQIKSAMKAVERGGDTPIRTQRALPKAIDKLPAPKELLKVLEEDGDVFNTTPTELKCEL